MFLYLFLWAGVRRDAHDRVTRAQADRDEPLPGQAKARKAARVISAARDHHATVLFRCVERE